MADTANQPTEADVRDFLAKLNDFRAALPDSEKTLLDALTTAAVSRSNQDVEGFGLTEYPSNLLIAAALESMLGSPPAKGKYRDVPPIVRD